MKERYVKPSIRVITFEREDILTTSIASLMIEDGVDASNMLDVSVGDTSSWEDYSAN